jgi:hypothetical protein
MRESLLFLDAFKVFYKVELFPSLLLNQFHQWMVFKIAKFSRNDCLSLKLGERT